MPKSIVLGNGNILVGLDNHGQLKDFYFPYVGLENHAGGHFIHKIGLWVENNFTWLDDGTWNISINCVKDTLASDITAENQLFAVRLHFNDVVYNEKNIFIRKITVENLTDRTRTIKLFFHQVFMIYESHRGDTALFDPIRHVMIHYKGRRVFMINLKMEHESFDDYAVGLYGIEGHEGTFKDAEDGALSKNAVEHGLVDSIIGKTIELSSHEKKTLFYWISVSKYIKEVNDMNEYVLAKSAKHLMKSTEDFWTAWLNRQNFLFYGLDEKTVDLFRKSLLYTRTHVDNTGGIVASADSDLLQYGRDTYSYVWPRDAALIAISLDKAGDHNVARRFFEYCNDILYDDGYFLHKYRPDKSLGSSWHPWVRDGKLSLPIQEDETALVIWALENHYKITRDLEFIESIYNSLIKRAANFMTIYRDPLTGLPGPSYDLWEEKNGIHTFTAASVYGALTCAHNFAKLLGKTEGAKKYHHAAEEIKAAILKHLWNEKNNTFYKSITYNNGEIIRDSTIDVSSIYGIFTFGVLPPEDKRVQDAVKQTIEHCSVKTDVEGYARYVGDRYYRTTDTVPGNPWFITTLWLAQYYIAISKTEKDLDIVKKWLYWVVRHAAPSGILSEQLDAVSGQPLSVAPLTWSHAEFVVTIVKYIEKMEHIGIFKSYFPQKNI